MRRNFKLAAVRLKRVTIRDPRVAMRAIIGMLLLANLVVAVIALKPFGGSADDLRQEEASLRGQLAALQARVTGGKRLVSKVETARREGDQFLAKYVTNRLVMASTSPIE